MRNSARLFEAGVAVSQLCRVLGSERLTLQLNQRPCLRRLSSAVSSTRVAVFIDLYMIDLRTTMCALPAEQLGGRLVGDGASRARSQRSYLACASEGGRSASWNVHTVAW